MGAAESRVEAVGRRLKQTHFQGLRGETSRKSVLRNSVFVTCVHCGDCIHPPLLTALSVTCGGASLLRTKAVELFRFGLSQEGTTPHHTPSLQVTGAK